MDKKITGLQNLRIIKKTVGYLFYEAWKLKPSYFPVYAANIFSLSLKPFLNIILPKFIIDELLGARNLTRIVLFTASLIMGNMILNFIWAHTREHIWRTYDFVFRKYSESKLGLKIMNMDFENTENKQILDQSEKAKMGISWYSGGIDGIMRAAAGIITASITMLGTVGILITGSPLMLLIVLVNVLLNFILNGRKNEIEVRHYKELSKVNRLFGYYQFQLSDIRYGKDVRLYAADEVVLSKARKQADEMGGTFRKNSKDTLKYIQASNMLRALQDGIAYLYLGYLAIRRIISIGSFSMYLAASAELSTSLNELVTQMRDLQKRCNYAYEYILFMEMPDHRKPGTLPCKREGEHWIEFKHVSFTYPGTKDYVLKDVSIKINQGEHISVVGLNGAGKTTFIKLICRLYEVSEGEILLDGVNINEYDYDDYIQLLSVVFQDFKLLAFTLKENITLEDASQVTDEDLTELLQKVGLKEKVEDLPNGLDTSVYRYYDKEGFEPSGGEQQKIAIARALYKDAPIVILDEPTAALDPVAEYEIYRQFNDLVKGKTAIYISHRLSSCKFCDKIAVFSGGRIAEYGTHEELYGLENGIYSEMFHAQAKYYV